MTHDQIELLADVVKKMNSARSSQLADFVESQGPEFAASAMLSVAADMAGTALALCKNPDSRKLGIAAFLMAVKAATDQASAEYAACELMDKVMEKS
jgi:hypothetical protein